MKNFKKIIFCTVYFELRFQDDMPCGINLAPYKNYNYFYKSNGCGNSFKQFFSIIKP